jgi:hypothetical protein
MNMVFIEKIYAETLCNKALPDLLGGCNGQGQEQGPVAIGNLLAGIVSMVMILGFFLTFAYLLTGAVSWITSNGEKGQLEAARNKITHGIIGLTILAVTYVTFGLVGQFMGITSGSSPINVNLPTLEQGAGK